MYAAVTIISLVLAAVVDRAAKIFLVAHPGYELTIVPRVLSFELVANSTGPLGLPISPNVVFVLLFSLAAAVALACCTSGSHRILVLFVTIGVASNTYDRSTLGFVVDTLRLSTGLAFNLADLYITLSLVVWGVSVFWTRWHRSLLITTTS